MIRAATGYLRPLITGLVLLACPHVRAALQFDVFVGYEGTVHEAGWFPVTCEVFNDGPSFNAVIEVTGGQFSPDQVRQVPVELPTNTRKRVVIPMFASGGRFTAEWNARLLDSNGKLRDERLKQQTKIVAWDSLLLGSVPRNFGGTPTLPDLRQPGREIKPEVARIQVEQFPDNPIALEGLSALYLNSEKAIELKANQVTALLAWVRGGGHLILAVEQVADINATPWLKQFAPMDLSGVQNALVQGPVMDWLRSGTEEKPRIRSNRPRQGMSDEVNAYQSILADGSFKDSEMAVAVGTVRDAQVLISGPGGPLAVEAPRGRGKLTLLTFSPEREPFRSWKSRSYFWAKLCGIPGEFFNMTNYNAYGGWSLDGVFGALLDSRQVKKLPVTWLLILLLVYLVVIGPFDQWWLKKIGRQMLTWITFPTYVVLFSLLIYFIGYKLRAGETEWNELNIVDMLPRQDKTDLRGRTFISVYSSSNARYPLAGQQGFATLRGELTDFYGGNRDTDKLRVVHTGNSFKSDIFVPVWTSKLFVNDWFRTNDTPFTAVVTRTAENRWTAEIDNLLNQPLQEVRLVVNEHVYDVGLVGPKEKKVLELKQEQSTPLRSAIQQNGSYFQRALELRRNPLGDTRGGRLENRALTATTASFGHYLNEGYGAQRGFIAPPGLDLSEQAQRGDAIVFAFVEGHTFAHDIHQFKPPRIKRDTLLRLVFPVKKPNAT